MQIHQHPWLEKWLIRDKCFNHCECCSLIRDSELGFKLNKSGAYIEFSNEVMTFSLARDIIELLGVVSVGSQRKGDKVW